MSITIGMKGTATKIVTENDTAKVVKSGSLPSSPPPSSRLSWKKPPAMR